jgi:hypothetical protein
MTSRSAAEEREFSFYSCYPDLLKLITMLLFRSEPQDERAPSAGAKSLAIPFDQSRWTPIEPGKTKCPACGKDAKRWTMFGRSY